MKNLVVLSLLSLFVFCFQTSYAQGNFDLSFGVGAFPTFAKDKGKVLVLPLSLNFDYKINKNFSLGLYTGYSVTETDREVINDGEVAQWQNKYSVYGIRAAAHTDKLDNWDIYGGMTLSYNHSRIDVIEGSKEKLEEHMGIKESSGKVSASGFVGARYSITKNLGVYTEVGFGISLLTAGVSYRF